MTLRSLAVCALIVAATTQARADDAFTRVPALEPNVAFWKHVYIDWSLNQIALHDDEDLGIVYRVFPVPARGEKNAAGLGRSDVVHKMQGELEAALRTLAKKNPTSADGLSGVEREVFVNLAGVKRADKYNRAAHIRVQNGLRERFLMGWSNSGLYESYIKGELRENGLPDDLIGIAFVESLFYVGARSKVGAAGIWQFMTYTGKEYMQLNNVVDERWDPVLSTEAACKYLKQAKKELGTWPLAITSYNYGRGGMKGLVENAGTKDFGVILAVSKNKRFGFAARNYYASFLAIHDIITGASVKGLGRKSAWTYDVIRAPFPLFSTQLVATGEVDAATFDFLNPALTTEARDGKVPLPHGISLRVPKGHGDKLLAKLAAFPDRERSRGMRAVKAVHRSTGKQSIGEIAKKYGLSGDTLAAAVGLDVADIPEKGQQIPIPPASARYTLLPEARGMPVPPLPSPVKILVAEAEKLDDKVVEPEPEPDRPTPKVVVASAPPIARGTVTVGPISVTDLTDVPAVDIIAGMSDSMLPDVDVVAGAQADSAAQPPIADAASVPNS